MSEAQAGRDGGESDSDAAGDEGTTPVAEDVDYYHMFLESLQQPHDSLQDAITDGHGLSIEGSAGKSGGLSSGGGFGISDSPAKNSRDGLDFGGDFQINWDSDDEEYMPDDSDVDMYVV